MTKIVADPAQAGSSLPRAADPVDRSDRVTLRGVGKSFGGVVALRAIDLDIRPGEIRGIIGPNGAGKSTLLNLISGVYRPDGGTIETGAATGRGLRAGRLAHLGVSRTFQNLALFEGLSIDDNIAMGRAAARRATTLERIVGLGRVRRERAETRAKVEDAIAFLGLGEVRGRAVASLPYGLQKRVELARAIVSEPRILLLDEPMAGMGSEDKAVLADLIRETRDRFGTTIVLIEHDVGIVMRLADRVTVLDHGRTIAEGAPDAVRRDPVVIDAYLGAEPPRVILREVAA